MSHTLHINGIPLPPTDNNLFPTVPVNGVMRRVRSREYNAWLSLMQGPHLKHKALISRASQAFRGLRLDVTIVLTLRWEHVYTKTKAANELLQELDAHNRIKAVCDWLSAVLEIDDRWFFKVSVEKRWHHRQDAKAQDVVAVTVQPMIDAPAEALGGATT